LAELFDVPFDCLSGSASGVCAVEELVLKSKAVPGVFGVFVAEPKEAKAPDPRPKAAPAPGDDTPDVFRAGIVLKGFERPGVVGSLAVKRFEVEYPRE
jgi:hypothetical protein